MCCVEQALVSVQGVVTGRKEVDVDVFVLVAWRMMMTLVM
jgi:hypothetical protein